MPEKTNTVNDFTPLAQRVARSVSWGATDVDDLVQEGLIALHHALQRTPRPRNPAGFASTVMRRAMLGYVSRERRSRDQLSLDELVRELTSDGDDVEERIDIDRYLAALEREHGRPARFVAENLIAPGDSFGRFVQVEVEDKQRRMREGCSVQLRGIEHVRVSHRQLAEALGLSRSRWFQLLDDVREFTVRWLTDPLDRARTT